MKAKGENVMARKNVTKIITWVCDKIKCNTRNTREIQYDFVINDDVCDFCHCSIHEPLTIELAVRNKKKNDNGNN